MAQDATGSSDELRNGIPEDQIAFLPPVPPVEPVTATYDAVALIYDAVLLLGIGATAAVVYFKTRDRNNHERTEKVTFDPQKTTPEQAVKDKVGNQNVPVSPKAQEALSSGKTAPSREDFSVIAQHFRANEGRTYSRSEIEAIQSQVGAPRDGSYGAETAEKVYQWQQTHGLAADGEAGSSTYQTMFGVSRQALIQQQQAAQNLAQRQAQSQAYLSYEAKLPQETRADMDGFYQQDPNRAAKIDREVQSRYGQVATANNDQVLATALRHHIINEWFTPNNYANQSPQDQAQRQAYLNREAQLPTSTKTDMDAFYSQNAGAATKIDQQVQNRYGQIATRSNDGPLTDAIRHQVIQELYAPSNYTGKSQQGGAVVENPSAPTQEPSTQPEQDPSQQTPDPGRKPPGDEPTRFPVPGDSNRENRPDLPTLDPLPGQGSPNPNQGPLSPEQPKDPNAPIELPKNPTPVQVPGSPTERPNEPSPNPQEPSTPPIQAERQEPQPSSTPNTDAQAEEPASTTEPEPENSPDADNYRFQSTGKPLVDRKVSELSPEERAELEKEYNITTRGEENRPVFTRHQPKEDHAPIHAEQENGEWVIKKGLEQNNNRLSNPYAMDKNSEAEYGPKPEGYQTHHLIPDETYQKNELTAELTERAKVQGEKPGIDKAENLIALPNGATAFNDESPEVQALEDKEALAKIVHNGSHPEWNKHANELLNERLEGLQDANPGKTLQEIPTEKLKQAEKSVMQQLRQELRDAAQQIKEGHPENLPEWIKPDYVPKDGNGQEFPKISEVPQQIPANALEASRNSTGATLTNSTETQQPNPAATFGPPEIEKIAVGKDPNPETVVISENPQPNTEDSITSEDQKFNDSIAEKIRASRERYPLPQPRAPQALNTTIADQNNPPQSPRESLASIKESNPSLHDTLSRLNNVIDELDKQTLARQPQPSPAQRLYEKTAQSVTQRTGLTPGHARFEPVLAAKLLAEHGYNQAASIIAAGSPRLNEVNATFGSTTADRQLAELMKQGQQTLQAMRPEQQKQQDQMEQG
jgi:hypothetical protein